MMHARGTRCHFHAGVTPRHTLGLTHVPGQRTHRRCNGPTCHASRSDIYQGLVSALATQFQQEALPWIEDLVVPLISPPPQPLDDTLSPKQLADSDSRFTTVNGVELHYKEYVNLADSSSTEESCPATTTTGPPPSVLMLHGFNGSEYNWRLVAQPLSDHLSAVQAPTATGDDSTTQPAARVVAYDRPPFGLSGRPLEWQYGSDTDPYTLSGGVELARGIIDKLSLGPVVVMGHSAGAPIALELAARYPELVSGVVLVSPAVFTDSKGFWATADAGRLLRFGLLRYVLSQDGAGLTYVRRQLRRRAEEVKQGKLDVAASDEQIASQTEVIENYLKPMRAHDWDRASLEVFRRSSLEGPKTVWSDVRAPVLIVQGDKDMTIPRSVALAVKATLDNARAGSAGVTAVEYHELVECGHLPMEEQPKEFVEVVSSWLTRVVGVSRQAAASSGAAALGQEVVQEGGGVAGVGVPERVVNYVSVQ